MGLEKNSITIPQTRLLYNSFHNLSIQTSKNPLLYKVPKICITPFIWKWCIEHYVLADSTLKTQ